MSGRGRQVLVPAAMATICFAVVLLRLAWNQLHSQKVRRPYKHNMVKPSGTPWLETCTENLRSSEASATKYVIAATLCGARLLSSNCVHSTAAGVVTQTHHDSNHDQVITQGCSQCLVAPSPTQAPKQCCHHSLTGLLPNMTLKNAQAVGDRHDSCNYFFM